MGAILSAPIRSQLLSRAGNATYRVGCSQMQGFRVDMEDAHSICLTLDGHPDVAFFGVYDGHAGDKVAHHLAAALPQHVAKLKELDDESLKQAVLSFDVEVGRQEFKHMGSTCVFALVKPAGESGSFDVTAVNVGDSRVMLLRANGDLLSMTEDHKPDDKLERQRILNAGGTVTSSRVDGGLAMSRAIGDFRYKEQRNLSALQQKVIALPDITHAVAHRGDRLLVVCDGIVERITNKEAAKYVHEKHKDLREDPATVMRELLLYSLARGSTDNQSAILVSFEDGTGYEQPDEFIAGPLYMGDPSSDSKFVNAYVKNASAWGQSAESLPPLIAEAEASMPKDWRAVGKPSENYGSAVLLYGPFLLMVLGVLFFTFVWNRQGDDFAYDGF